MPETLDILIGFTVVMLIVSLPVTMITQGIGEFLNLRGVALRHGVVSLLGLLDDRLKDDGLAIATKLLKDPLIARRGIAGGNRLAGTVHREELAKLIIRLAATAPDTARAASLARADAAAEVAAASAANDPDRLRAAKAAAFDAVQANPPPVEANDDDRSSLWRWLAGPTAKLTDDAHNLVGTVLAGLDITHPEAVLKAVRAAQLGFERLEPAAATDVRATKAMLAEATSDFLAKFNAWFDQSMDRVSETFTLYSRFVTLFVALAVVVVLQLDAITLVNRLSADKHVRDALVAGALKDPARFNPGLPPAEGIKRAEADDKSAQGELTKATAEVDRNAAVVAAATSDTDKASAAAALATAKTARSEADDKAAATAIRLQLAKARKTLAEAAANTVAAREKTAKTPDDADKQQVLAAAEAAEQDAAKTVADLDTPANIATVLGNDPGLNDVVNLRLVELPQSLTGWWNGWTADTWLRHLTGILLSAALLSLGGPFWYALLENLLKFRPTIAKKDDEQRKTRQTAQTA